MLTYHAVATGPVTPAALEAAMTAIVLDPTSIEQATGCTFVSDLTTLAGATATRTVIFNINTARFIAQFPAGTDVASPFRDLFTHILGLGLNSKVVADAVIIA